MMTTLVASKDILTGCTETHLQHIAEGIAIHRQMTSAWLALQKAAETDGITIKIVSGFRSFQRQAAIWQAKCDGLRPVYNLEQQRVPVTTLTGLSKLEAILLYSALPGASRHHWGTELDIYDAAAVAADYQPQLLNAEYQPAGPFARLTQWLSDNALHFGFFQPYQHYLGGVAAEPWHLSFAPIAIPYLQAFTLETLRQCIEQHSIAEQHTVLEHLPHLYQTYVINICDSVK
jgi:LAS superfamily LD-carboxypeptidase LdcB